MTTGKRILLEQGPELLGNSISNAMEIYTTQAPLKKHSPGPLLETLADDCYVELLPAAAAAADINDQQHPSMDELMKIWNSARMLNDRLMASQESGNNNNNISDQASNDYAMAIRLYEQVLEGMLTYLLSLIPIGGRNAVEMPTGILDKLSHSLIVSLLPAHITTHLCNYLTCQLEFAELINVPDVLCNVYYTLSAVMYNVMGENRSMSAQFAVLYVKSSVHMCRIHRNSIGLVAEVEEEEEEEESYGEQELIQDYSDSSVSRFGRALLSEQEGQLMFRVMQYVNGLPKTEFIQCVTLLQDEWWPHMQSQSNTENNTFKLNGASQMRLLACAQSILESKLAGLLSHQLMGNLLFACVQAMQFCYQREHAENISNFALLKSIGRTLRILHLMPKSEYAQLPSVFDRAYQRALNTESCGLLMVLAINCVSSSTVDDNVIDDYITRAQRYFTRSWNTSAKMKDLSVDQEWPQWQQECISALQSRVRMQLDQMSVFDDGL